MAAPFHQIEQLVPTKLALIARAPVNTSNASNSRERGGEMAIAVICLFPYTLKISDYLYACVSEFFITWSSKGLSRVICIFVRTLISVIPYGFSEKTRLSECDLLGNSRASDDRDFPKSPNNCKGGRLRINTNANHDTRSLSKL